MLRVYLVWQTEFETYYEIHRKGRNNGICWRQQTKDIISIFKSKNRISKWNRIAIVVSQSDGSDGSQQQNSVRLKSKSIFIVQLLLITRFKCGRCAVCNCQWFIYYNIVKWINCWFVKIWTFWIIQWLCSVYGACEAVSVVDG